MDLNDQCGVTMKHNENLYENVLMTIDYEMNTSPKCLSKNNFLQNSETLKPYSDRILTYSGDYSPISPYYP